ncbi:MAG: tripartite tricarboxylate transporter substrate binding protein [Mailhella sp.]|nr:tripartite tricarboxylate transporter substrate binding protein [Mailhella sp.]
MKRIASAFLAACLLFPATSMAANYPTHPITVISGFAAGGTSDIALRAMAPELEKELGQPVLIVNKGGAGGALAVGDVLTKKADGYTIGFVLATAFTLDVQLKKARYAIEDFKYLGNVGVSQEGFFAAADAPFKSFSEMVEYAKKTGKELTCASPAIIDTMMLKVVEAKSGVKFRKVPVKSGGETATQLLGGHVDMGYGGGIQTPYVKAGKMINLAATNATPLVLFPDCPTLESMGYPHTGYDNLFVLYVKKDVPDEICKKLSDAIYKVSNMPAIQDIFLNKAGRSPQAYKAEEIKPILLKQRSDYKALIEAGK